MGPERVPASAGLGASPRFVVTQSMAITARARYFGTSPHLWMNLQKTYEPYSHEVAR